MILSGTVYPQLYILAVKIGRVVDFGSRSRNIFPNRDTFKYNSYRNISIYRRASLREIEQSDRSVRRTRIYIKLEIFHELRSTFSRVSRAIFRCRRREITRV